MKYVVKHHSLWSVFAHLFHPRRSNNHRARLLHPESYLLFTVILIVAIVTVPLVAKTGGRAGFVLGYASDISTDQVVTQTNSQRATAGLRPLSENATLAQAAAAKAEHMFAEQYWAHTSPGGKEPWDFMKEVGYTYRRAGENLARDFMITPTMITAWMDSPTHRANIMNGNFTQIGVAVRNGTLDGVETTLVVQMFGTPLESVPIAQVSEHAETVTIEAPDLSQEGEQGLPSQEQANLVVREELANGEGQQESVLAGQAVPVGTVTQRIIYSPLHISKAIALAVVLLILVVLVYDGLVAYSSKTIRLVGKNMAHLCLFLTVAFILIFFKGGLIQ